MKIEFEPGEIGYHEASELSAIVRYVVHNTVSGSHDLQVLDFIEQTTAAHMQRPEFAGFAATPAPAIDDRTPVRRLADIWHELFGPSAREIELSNQRVEALARAERAEHSAFEALAEMARIARERDEARSQLQEITARVDRLYADRKRAEKP